MENPVTQELYRQAIRETFEGMNLRKVAFEIDAWLIEVLNFMDGHQNNYVMSQIESFLAP